MKILTANTLTTKEYMRKVRSRYVHRMRVLKNDIESPAHEPSMSKAQSAATRKNNKLKKDFPLFDQAGLLEDQKLDPAAYYREKVRSFQFWFPKGASRYMDELREIEEFVFTEDPFVIYIINGLRLKGFCNPFDRNSIELIRMIYKRTYGIEPVWYGRKYFGE